MFANLSRTIGLMVIASCSTGCFLWSSDECEQEVYFLQYDEDGELYGLANEPVCTEFSGTQNVGPCVVHEWDIVRDRDANETFFRYQTGDSGVCVNFFQARKLLTDYYGSTIREFATGSGPFATGTWTSGSLSGTFVFYERESQLPPLP